MLRALCCGEVLWKLLGFLTLSEMCQKDCPGKCGQGARSPYLTVLLSRAIYVPGSLEKNKHSTGSLWSLTPCLVRAGAWGSCPNCCPPLAAATPRAAVQPDTRQVNRQMPSPVVRGASPRSCCTVLSEISSSKNNGPCKETAKRHRTGQTPSDAACDCSQISGPAKKTSEYAL